MSETKGQFKGAALEIAPILATLFTVLVATDPFNARGRSHLLVILSEVALGLWVATILLLLSQVRPSSAKTSVRPKATWAVGSVALLVTAGMFVLIPTSYGVDTDHVAVALVQANRDALDLLCQTKGKNLDGRIGTGSLDGAFIVLTLDDGVSARCDDVRIPVASILALREIH